MKRKSCSSARSCCPSTRTVISPKQESVVTMKPPKVEDVTLETTKKVEGNVLNSIKLEDRSPESLLLRS